MLSEHLTQFLQHLKYERNLSPHTLRNYASDLEQFKEHLFAIEKRDDMPMAEIDRLTIREWMASLHADHKKTSVARKLASLRTFFQFLIREGKLESNPAKMVATPKIERKLPNHLTIEDAVRFIETPDVNTDLGCRDRAILEFLYATGIRVGELVGINIGRRRSSRKDGACYRQTQKAAYRSVWRACGRGFDALSRRNSRPLFGKLPDHTTRRKCTVLELPRHADHNALGRPDDR